MWSKCKIGSSWGLVMITDSLTRLSECGTVQEDWDRVIAIADFCVCRCLNVEQRRTGTVELGRRKETTRKKGKCALIDMKRFGVAGLRLRRKLLLVVVTAMPRARYFLNCVGINYDIIFRSGMAKNSCTRHSDKRLL